jgi:dolichyl-phosphate-mannose-protein mannosyltransferase
MGRSSNRSPEKASVRPQQVAVKKHDDYTSDGVVDTDVFLLPVSDYQAMIFVTVVAAVVRLFRIYQPSSVVFDEVQSVMYS